MCLEMSRTSEIEREEEGKRERKRERERERKGDGSSDVYKIAARTHIHVYICTDTGVATRVLRTKVYVHRCMYIELVVREKNAYQNH